MATPGLTESLQAAIDALPADWTLHGVIRGPREGDPTIRGAVWVAWATGPDDERIQGAGGNPEDAIQQLTVYLREFLTASVAHS